MNPTALISRLESLTPEEKTPELTELESELRDHAKYFNDLITQIATTGVLTEEIKRERYARKNMMQKVVEKVYEFLYPLETLFHLKKSYETQVSRYRSLGWVVEQSGKEGIIGLDTNFYPMPHFEDVREVLAEQSELLTYKYSQGFKKFMLVPFGMSYVEMYKKLETEYKRYAEAPNTEGLGLYLTDSERTQICNIEQSPWIYDPMKKERALGYYPETFCSKDPTVHMAKSKDSLIKSNRFPGWEIHLVYMDTECAENGIGRIVGDRPVFELETNLDDCLEVMKGRDGANLGIIPSSVKKVMDREGKNVYRGEVGLIPEVWATWALEELYANNHVLHAYNVIDKGFQAGLLGILIENDGTATSYFNSLEGIVNVSMEGTHNSLSNCAGVSSVKVC